MARRLLPRSLLFVIVSIACGASAAAQSAKPFQGEWEWAVYATDRSELPPAYRNAPLKEIPGAAIYLKIKQRGNKLTGEYSGSARFLARLEEGEFDTIARGNTAELELTSGFGGTATVRLTLRGNRMQWKAIKSEGEFYFPRDVFLHRLVRKKRRN
jgi:hypothetical protein